MSNLKKRVQTLERELILEALRRAGWIKAKAARSLGITDRILDYKMKKYGVQKIYKADDASAPEAGPGGPDRHEN